jgi:hypothetical protein
MTWTSHRSLLRLGHNGPTLCSSPRVTGGESIRVIRKSRVFALLSKDSILCDRETAVYLLPTI